MATRWFNLYGVDPKDRNAKTKGRKEGSSYLGRVLINFNVVPMDRPQLCPQNSGPLKEPQQQTFQLWVDVYEWIKCGFIEKGGRLWVQVTMGCHQSDPQVAKLKKNTQD